ncbi:class I SAM-dependent methyltransferase [Actinophytocola xanthii]|uniref:SAM-dependent methyltransferase n=1 Tax=Actinophytocola xanthii TaxID=1912961 RepID=A0A1Q8CAE3_9PSEU|nr:class I SAM-dependent methyltransferase [Actinophytocola xanthii]OLF11300.1 SAM-dependent methyltransferase [Actinophytocola xanthii]
MYEDDLAEVYATYYEGLGKSYATEAARLRVLVEQLKPDASSLLDSACGSGEHLRGLRELFDHVEGLELSEAMLRVARRNLPGVPLHHADMRRFDLGRRFDAVTCMFSSIGHVATPAELNATLACFARHLVPGGVVAVEPWWFPENAVERWVAGDAVHRDGRTITRVSHSVRENGATRVRVHFAVADLQAGLHHFSEDYRLTLFSRETYEQAFVDAGFAVEFVEGGPLGRGLFVGVRK